KAGLQKDQGKWQEAINLYDSIEALPIFKSVDVRDVASAKQSRSIALNKMGRPDLAEVGLLEAISILREANVPEHLSFTQSSLVRSLNLQGRYAEAEEVFLECLQTLEGVYANNKAPVWGEIYARAATTQSLQNNFDRADSLLRLSVIGLMGEPAFQGPADLPIIAGATIYGQEDMWEMLTSKRDMLIRAYEQGARPEGLELALATCRTIDTLLRYNRSQLSLTSSLGQLIRLEADEYVQAVDVALRLYRTTGEARYLEEAYQFVAGQKSNLLRRYLTSPNLASSLGVPEEVIEAKSDLEIKVLATEEALADATEANRQVLRDSLLRLNNEADNLRRQLEEEYPAFAQALRGFPEIDPVQAAAALSTDQLLIEYFLSADSIYTFTLSKATSLTVYTTARPDNLLELIGSVVEQGEGATALYELLVEPVLTNRPAITRLQFIPDGDLWKIPFAALKQGENFLIQNYAVSFAYAAPLLFDETLAAQARA
ncbi:MAG: CHAT domain-containing protein, partial [Bacteroidota bacterium]